MAVIEYDATGKGHNADGKRIAETISVVELFRLFPYEDTCYAWLEDARWHGTPVCPHCGGIENIVDDPRPRHYRHKDCRKRFTATTGTCMHSTKRPLQDWIYILYSVITACKGVSALQMSKEIGVQYRTAWHMLHRIREACGRGDFTLNDTVEVDETYIGGKVKAEPVARTDAQTFRGYVEDAVEMEATVYTVDAATYGALPRPVHRRGANMNRKQFDKTERREVSKDDFMDALTQILVSGEPKRPRAENREPTKAELERRYRLDHED